MASPAVGWAIRKLDELLTGEVSLFRDVHRESRDLKDELEAIQAFLRDADVKLYQDNVDNRVKIWVKQVKEISFCIEDVIDEYMLHVARNQDKHGWISKIVPSVKNSSTRRGVASKIQDIKKTVREIRERSSRYNFVSSSEQGSNHKWLDPRVASLFIEEAELVGIESPKADLISRLVEGAAKNTTISVVGMGGLGKTTLSKKVYDSESVTACFDCKAWITVSQSYKMEELLRNMLQQFRRDTVLPAFEGMEKTIEKLREYLAEKRYVVVFDDVWGIDFWGYIKIALPDNGKGNGVIITTRNEGVVPSPNESPFYHIFKLQPLPEKKAYELFCKKVFQTSGGNCPPELQDLSYAIVEKCEGLPLAIVTIGGVLASRVKFVSEWKSFYDGLSSSLASDQRLSNIIKILSLSYHDLPYHLKSCFLYLSLFPEDYSISCWRLIRLWIAEGFIKERRGKKVEEVAEEYLTELVHRSLIQVERVSIHGKARECRVHDLMREIILSRSSELSFHQIPVENYQSLKGRSRHLSINDDATIVSEDNCDSQTHSIILFAVNELPKSFISSLIQKFKLLRSLDFEGAPLDSIPDELGNLWHLRYLSLKHTDVKKLPKSIGKLCNLETLDLRQTLVYDIPIEINRLLKLKQLLAYFCKYDDDNEYSPTFRRGMKLKGGIGCLKALEKLSDIEVDRDVDIISQVERLTQLRKLRIKKMRNEHGLALSSALEKLNCLKTLCVSSINKEEALDLQSISAPPPFLQHLYLMGPLIEFPPWIPKLTALVKIHLSWSRLGNGAMEVIQALPNLLYLWFYDAYDGEQLHFMEGSFPKLKVLHLEFMVELHTLTIDDGALPVLEELFIGPCPMLMEIPGGLSFLRNVKRLELVDIRIEFAIAMKPNGGPDYWKVKHIPLVLFFYQEAKGFKFDRYKLGELDLLRRLANVSSR